MVDKLNKNNSPASSRIKSQNSEKSGSPKTGRTVSEEALLEKKRYYADGYFNVDHFISISEQIRLVRGLKSTNILEIGIGNGLVSDFLRKAGYNVTTFDINPNLNPDVIGSVTDLVEALNHRKFDLILCAEVLEHMPFEYFEQVINNIALTTNEYAILTLPRSQKVIFDIQCKIKIPKMPYFNTGLFFSLPISSVPPEHHWQLDSSVQTKREEIVKIITQQFKIVDSGRFRFRSDHYYFILKKVLHG